MCQKNGYDALGRPTSVTLQDGSVSSVSYSNNTVTSSDPAGKTRQSTFDGLGRLTQVIEDPGSSPHLNYVTSYAVDALGNITGVTQNGVFQRTYVWDAMSRLTSETNPESSTVTYKYDSDSSCASPNSSAGDLISRTDARSIRTCLQYDALHRLTAKNYSDSTPSVSFLYDVASTNGVTISNPVGRLVRSLQSSPCAGIINSYDSMGRVTTQWQYGPYVCAGGHGAAAYVFSYNYDFAGDITSYTNGVGNTFTQSIDSAGRFTGLTSSFVDSQHPATLATVDPTLGYYPHGAIRKMTLDNGLVTQTAAFNNRLQPCRLNLNSSGAALGACSDAVPSGNVQDFNYSFGASPNNNGNVASWTGTGQQAFNTTYGYDALNRLSTLSSPSDPTGCTGLSWSYDPWGNCTDQSLTGGTCNSFHATVNSQNQLSGSPYVYDAAGNMTNDGNHAYFYDAENRLIQVDGTLGTCSTATACYVYDAEGKRVQSITSVTAEFLYDLQGRWISQVDGTDGHVRWNEIYGGGQHLASYSGGTTNFSFADLLGTERVRTAMSGAVSETCTNLPFGDALNCTGTDWSRMHFTGDERDFESGAGGFAGLDHTQFRQYSSQLGRWMHPDPAGLAAADPSNPQSWNRYSYVLNNPMNFIDPLGLHRRLPGGEVVDDDVEDCESEGGTFTNDPLTGSIGNPGGLAGSDDGLSGLGFLGVAGPGGWGSVDLPAFFMLIEVWGTNVFDTAGINGDNPGGGGGVASTGVRFGPFFPCIGGTTYLAGTTSGCTTVPLPDPQTLKQVVNFVTNLCIQREIAKKDNLADLLVGALFGAPHGGIGAIFGAGGGAATVVIKAASSCAESGQYIP